MASPLSRTSSVVSSVSSTTAFYQQGLPTHIVEQFPKSRYSAVVGDNLDEDQRTCTICLEEYVENDVIRRLACTHAYHTCCIDTWLSKSTQCPICKFDYVVMLQ